MQLMDYGGLSGHLIMLLAAAAAALSVQFLFSIRMSRLAPPKDVSVIRKLIGEGKTAELVKMDQRKISLLARVVAGGAREMNADRAAMLTDMEMTARISTARLACGIERLRLIGKIAPLLGALGTAAGLLRWCGRISRLRDTLEPQQLAEGISEALAPGIEGLIVGIPALILYDLFRNRLEESTDRVFMTARELVGSHSPSEGQGRQI